VSRPELPASAFQTFSLRRPRTEAFWRRATCEEADCQAWRHGWRTTVEADSPQANYIRSRSGRRFIESRDEGGLAVFEFWPGQPCFAASEHRVPIEREPLYVVRTGTSAVAAGEARRHTRGADWVENFSEELGKVAEDRKRG